MTTNAHKISFLNLLYFLLHARSPHLGGDSGDLQTYFPTLYFKVDNILKTFIIIFFVLNNIFNFVQKYCTPPGSYFSALKHSYVVQIWSHTLHQNLWSWYFSLIIVEIIYPIPQKLSMDYYGTSKSPNNKQIWSNQTSLQHTKTTMASLMNRTNIWYQTYIQTH